MLLRTTFLILSAMLLSCRVPAVPVPEIPDAALSAKPIAAEDAVVDAPLNAPSAALRSVHEDGRKPGGPKQEGPYEGVDISRFLEGVEGTFVFLDIERNIRLVYNETRANTRFSPCSTFKIPNTLIALEVGSATGPDMAINWNASVYPKQPWWNAIGLDWARNHTVKTAFQNSCVWFYRELAKKTGAEEMQAYLDKFDYGNRDITGGIDAFWLESSLQISAQEQVDFLQRLAEHNLGLNEKTMREGFIVFERERKDNAVLYAKTGGGTDIGWFVGIVDNAEKKYVFAFNMAGDFTATATKRVDLSLKILQELGVWF